jgi:hypothetical protein
LADHFEPRRNVLQKLDHIFAERLERAAAVGAGRLRRRHGFDFAGEVGGQRPADRASTFVRNGQWDGRLRSGLLNLAVFELHLQLPQVAIELLRLTPELLASQLGD